MTKSVDPGRMAAGNPFGSIKVGAGEFPIPLLGSEFLNLAPTTRRHVLSKREMVPHPTINFVLTELSEGRTVSELDTYNNSSSRYRRSDSVNVLREIHRRFPKKTALLLQEGLWTLAPLPERTAP